MLTDMSINNDNHKLTLTLFFMIIVILTSRTCWFFPSCVVFEPIYGHSVSFRETGLLSLYILPKVGYSDEAVNPIR